MKDEKLAEPKQLFVHEPDCQLRCARFSPDGQVLFAAGLDASIRRWKTAEDKLMELPAINGHHGWTSKVLPHPNRKQLISVDTWGQLRCTAFENDKPKTLWQHDEAHDGWIRDVGVSGDGTRIATCGRDRAVRIWSAEGKLLNERMAAEDVYAVTFAAERNSVVFGDEKGAIHLWNPRADKMVREFDGSQFYKYDRIQEVAGLQGFCWLDNGATLVAFGTKPEKGATVRSVPLIRLFDLETGKLKQSIEVGTNKYGFIHDLAVHPDGYLMGTASGTPGSGLLFFIRPGEKEPFYQHTKVSNLHSISLHPDHRRIAFTATNRRSNGNGRRLDENGEYPANNSPIHVFELPA